MRNICVFVHLDDRPVEGKSEEETQKAVAFIYKLASEFGFKVNKKKLCLTPSQQPGGIGPPEEHGFSHIRASRAVPSLAWLRLLGLLASMVDVVPWC